MHAETFKNITAGISSITAAISSIATAIALAVGGYWAYHRFIRFREAATKIDVNVDLTFVHNHREHWIVEGVALLENKGNVRLNFREFTFEIRYALPSDDLGRKTVEEGSIEGSGTIELPHVAAQGSWLEGFFDWYLEPGERSRFSFLASVPSDSTMVWLKSEFIDENDDLEPVFKLYAVPKNLS